MENYEADTIIFPKKKKKIPKNIGYSTKNFIKYETPIIRTSGGKKLRNTPCTKKIYQTFWKSTWKSTRYLIFVEKNSKTIFNPKISERIANDRNFDTRY